MARTPASPPPMQPQAPIAQPIAPPPQVMQQGQKVTLLEAIAAATNSFGEMVKDSKNSFTNSPYQKLPALLQAIKPALLDQGVVIYSQVVAVDRCWVVRTTLALVDGSEELSSDFPVPDYTGVETLAKNGALIKSPGPATRDQIGAAMTYGTRYNLYALLAVCPVEDDDGSSGHFNPPAATQLPGLPGGVPSWPAPGQQVQAPPATFPANMHPGWQVQPPMATMPPAMVNPVQPLPVLS